MATNRFRLRFTFWLDMLKPDELALADQIEQLKNQRSFASTIHDGIRLIGDLRAGRVDVLFELFPWVKAEFLAGVQSQETAGERALREQLARIEHQLLKQRNIPVHLPSAGPKAMAVPQFKSPDWEEDDAAELVVRKDTRTSSAHNFITSMLNLQQ